MKCKKYQWKKVKRKEDEQDFDEIERLSKEFTQKWKSFFRGIWEDVKQSSAENIESNIKKAWQKQDKKFYVECIKKAYDLGEKRAQSITEQVLQDDILLPENGIGIEREDIQQELLNNALSRVSKMEQSTIEDVRKILVKGHEQGENWKEQKKKIENRIKNPVRAEMIAITELGHAYNTSTKNTYRGAGASKVAWHASLDLKTCDICRTLHGQVFDINDAPDNPAHPRCRCTWLPVFSERNSRTFDNIPKSIDKKENSNYNKVRTQEELQKAAENMKVVAEQYSVNPSKWSGKVIVGNKAFKKDTLARKEWSCNISVVNFADDGIILHEMLHSCSSSYYGETTFENNQFIEEGSVEFLKQQICIEKNIISRKGYKPFTTILKAINDRFNYGTDLEFAQELFNVPFPDRYEWLENKVDKSLKQENVAIEDYIAVMEFVKKLKGGIK